MALLQQVRKDAHIVLDRPPETGYGWPPDWIWDPAATSTENLQKARFLLDVQLSEPGVELLDLRYPDQDEVAAWCEQFHNSLEIQLLQLVEEVGEIARAVVKRAQSIRGNYEEWTEKIREELGDAFISLLNVADIAGFDLATVAAQRWHEKIKTRDFAADPQQHGLPEEDA
jgi:NTP pyrophosphatase (non-canonical NTP hydrolase)